MKTCPRQLLLVFSQFHVFSESAGFLRAGHILMESSNCMHWEHKSCLPLHYSQWHSQELFLTGVTYNKNRRWEVVKKSSSPK